MKIGCPCESLYLEKKKNTLPYIRFGFKCVVMYLKCHNACKKKSLNKFSLAADLLNRVVRIKLGSN